MPRKKSEFDVDPNDFVPILDAAAILDEYSISTMRRRIASGDWIEGLHWTNNASRNGKNRKILINIKEVKKLRTVSASVR